MKDPSHPEVQFGRLATRLGLVPEERVEECLRLRVDLAFAGVRRLPRLQDLFVERGWLTPKQAEWISRLVRTMFSERIPG